IQLFLIAEADRLQGYNRFTRLVHRFDLILEAGGRLDRTELTAGVNNYSHSIGHNLTGDASDEGFLLCPCFAYPDGIGFIPRTGRTNIDVVTPRRQVGAGSCSEGNVV